MLSVTVLIVDSASFFAIGIHKKVIVLYVILYGSKNVVKFTTSYKFEKCQFLNFVASNLRIVYCMFTTICKITVSFN